MLRRKCKYNPYSYCDIDEPDTLCDGDGCEYAVYGKETDDFDEPDPDREYERMRDEGKL